MGLDEVGTAHTLREHRKVTDALVTKHGGRLVKSTGDGVLLEFPSVVDAVECCVAVQEVLAQRNEGVREDRRMLFRIGINLGDILIEGEDILGDGVNVAARLEGIAEPGGICISASAYDQVRGKVAVDFADLGERMLKNIDRPVRVYATKSTAGEGSGTVKASKPLPLPDRPSIAVLPFQNMSGDAEQEYFADGIVEDIITALARFKLLFVIARNSSFTYKGKPIDIKQVGRELGVRYVLEGSVRRAGIKVRITGQLIDASSGTHLWADHFDGILEDIFDLQDRVTGKVVAAIAPKVQQAELERSTRKPTESLEAYDYYLRGLALHPKPTKEGIEEALRLFSKAIELDPNFAAPYAAATRCYSTRRAFGWETDLEWEAEETSRLIQRATALGSDDAFVLGLCGFQTFYVLGDVEGGAALLERARSLNPNLAILWGGGGLINACLGQPDVGIKQMEYAMRLSPFDPSMGLWQNGTALAHFIDGRYEDAVRWATMSLRDGGVIGNTLTTLAAGQALLGRTDEARKAVARLQSVHPNWRISNLPDLRLIRRAEDREKFIEGLRLAGLPE
jgi:adenylate cyclase